MKVVEDFESGPHKAVSFFFVEREEEIREWNEQKMPVMLSGYNVGRLPRKRQNRRGRRRGQQRETCKVCNCPRSDWRHQGEGKVPDLVVHERMSQGEEVRGAKE